jgi:hypothetical protein
VLFPKPCLPSTFFSGAGSSRAQRATVPGFKFVAHPQPVVHCTCTFMAAALARNFVKFFTNLD